MINQLLQSQNACESAILEHGQDPDLQFAWNRCKRSDWMIWVLQRTKSKEDKKLWVQISLAAAKSVIHLSTDPEQRPQKALEAVEKWLLDPSEENRLLCGEAARSARSAWSAARSAARSAAWSAWSAWSAAWSAAGSAAGSADRSAAWSAALEQNRQQIADVIRTLHPKIGEFV